MSDVCTCTKIKILTCDTFWASYVVFLYFTDRQSYIARLAFVLTLLKFHSQNTTGSSWVTTSDPFLASFTLNIMQAKPTSQTSLINGFCSSERKQRKEKKNKIIFFCRYVNVLSDNSEWLSFLLFCCVLYVHFTRCALTWKLNTPKIHIICIHYVCLF